MTDREPYRLCCTCFRAFPPPGAYKCSDCDPGRVVPNAATKPSRPKIDLSEGLPESFADPQKGKQHDQ